MIDDGSLARHVRSKAKATKKTLDMSKKATWELSQMVDAMSRVPWLNSDADNQRLNAAKQELKRRMK